MKTIFVFSIMVILVAGVIAPALPYSHADIIPPKHQAKIGISNDDIVCDSGLFKIFKTGSDTVVCVTPNTAAKLVNSDWAKKVDEKTLNDLINKKSVDLGTISIIETTPIKTNLGKLASGAPISQYGIVFEVCASSPIYAPDVLIVSDSDTKHYELTELVEADSCVLSATKLKAADPKSINITLQNKGDISNKVVTLQQELDSLKTQLETVRQSMKSPTDIDAQKQGKKIADLRKQINDTREKLHRILFTIHVSPTSKQKIEKMTFSGQVIEGASAKVLSVLNATQTSSAYDAIFEACAGPSTIKLPVVTITSDKQSIQVKLGQKISANSCQMTSVQIEADDKSTITANPAGNGKSSTKASDLEVKIVSLQDSLVKEKQTLKSLIHNSDRPANFVELFDAHIVKITELRSQITTAKADFNKILYSSYN